MCLARRNDGQAGEMMGMSCLLRQSAVFAHFLAEFTGSGGEKRWAVRHDPISALWPPNVGDMRNQTNTLPEIFPACRADRRGEPILDLVGGAMLGSLMTGQSTL